MNMRNASLCIRDLAPLSSPEKYMSTSVFTVVCLKIHSTYLKLLNSDNITLKYTTKKC